MLAMSPMGFTSRRSTYRMGEEVFRRTEVMGDAFAAAEEIARLIRNEKVKQPDNMTLQEVLSRIEKRCQEIADSSRGGWY